MLALTFQVGADRVAVDVRRVREVVPRVHLRQPAGSPSWLAGLFVHRGRVVPVVDLFRLTGAGDCPLHLSSRIILVSRVDMDDGLLGLLATQVADLREIDMAGASAIDVTAMHQPRLGVLVAEGAGMIRILDPDRLLPEGALASLRAATPAGVS